MSDHAHSIMSANTIKQPEPTYLEEHFDGQLGRASTTFRYLLKKQMHHTEYVGLLRQLRKTAKDRCLDEIAEEIDGEIEQQLAQADGFAKAAQHLWDKTLSTEN
jgi:hypothetical protein